MSGSYRAPAPPVDPAPYAVGAAERCSCEAGPVDDRGYCWECGLHRKDRQA